jgi:hypothetical protein
MRRFSLLLQQFETALRRERNVLVNLGEALSCTAANG